TSTRKVFIERKTIQLPPLSIGSIRLDGARANVGKKQSDVVCLAASGERTPQTLESRGRGPAAHAWLRPDAVYHAKADQLRSGHDLAAATDDLNLQHMPALWYVIKLEDGNETVASRAAPVEQQTKAHLRHHIDRGQLCLHEQMSAQVIDSRVRQRLLDANRGRCPGLMRTEHRGKQCKAHHRARERHPQRHHRTAEEGTTSAGCRPQAAFFTQALHHALAGTVLPPKRAQGADLADASP